MYKAESNVCKIEKQPFPIVRTQTKTYKKSLTLAQKNEWIQLIKDESNLFNEIYPSSPSNIALASSHSNEFKIKSYLFMPNLGEIPVPKLNFRNLTFGEKLNLIIAMIAAVKSCHEKNILHRDIKLYNFVYRRKDNKIHLVDFGFATKVNPSERLKLDCGTPSYIAPDVYSSYASDIYALGGCIAEIMGGSKVFKEKNEVARNLQRFKPYYLNEIESYSPAPTFLDKKNIATIKTIIEKMTNDDSQNRGTIQEIYGLFKKLQDEFLLNELSKLDENLGKIKADIEADIKADTQSLNSSNPEIQIKEELLSKKADIKADTQSLNFSNAKIQIKKELLSKIDTLRKNMATNLHLNQISCEKYEKYFKQAFELFHQDNVNKIYEHRNKFVKFFNTLTRPLSFIFGLLSHNELLTKRGFFLTKSSKILINAEKTLTLSQQSVRLNLTKP